MSKRTFVCFDCRTTERVPMERITRDCRVCHEPAEHVYFKFRIPKRGDDEGWSDLMRKVRAVNDQIKRGWMRSLQSQAERTARSPSRRAAQQLREIEERIAKLERWR